MAKKATKKTAAKTKADVIHPAAKPFLWLGEKRAQNGFIWIPVAGMIVMIVLGYFYPPEHKAPWDFFFGSWAVIGFFAYSFVVISAEPLFKLLSRPENYYGDDERLPDGPDFGGDDHV